MKCTTALPLGAGFLGWMLVSAQPVAEIRQGPVNGWTKLPAPTVSPYVFSQPLYVPSRKQVLHWGAVGGNDIPANDVRAFDAARGAWTGDYPSAGKDELGKAVLPDWA